MKIPVSLPITKPFLWLSGCAFATLSGLSGDTYTDTFWFDTFNEVTDLSEYDWFREFYTYPIVSTGLTTAADEIVILRDFVVRTETYVIDEDEDEYEYEYLTFADYKAATESPVSVPEEGYLAFKFKDTEAYVSSTGAVGFMRKSQYVSQIPGEKVEGLFAGARGTGEWDSLDTDNEMLIELDYELNGVSSHQSLEGTYTTTSDGLSIGGFNFPVTDEEDSLEWYFSAASMDHLGAGEFCGYIIRNDYLEEEDFDEDILPEGVDPLTTWNVLYVFRFSSPYDADQDHQPDILDSTVSITAYPWYADVELYGDWYWSNWLGIWIYSDRIHTWDYWQGMGWVYVDESSTRDEFWYYAPNISSGWLVTATGLYPTAYDTETEDYVYIVTVENGDAYLYSYSAKEWRPVNP